MASLIVTFFTHHRFAHHHFAHRRFDRFATLIYERAQQIKDASKCALERSRSDPETKDECTTWMGIMQAIKLQVEQGGGVGGAVGAGRVEGEAGAGGAERETPLMLAANPNPNE